MTHMETETNSNPDEPALPPQGEPKSDATRTNGLSKDEREAAGCAIVALVMVALVVLLFFVLGSNVLPPGGR